MIRISSPQTGFVRHQLGQAVVLGILGVGAGNAQAFNFDTESGWSGSLDTTLSVGSSWRAEGRDNELYSRLDGQVIGKTDGLGGSNTDGGNLNYDRGDRFSTIGKFLTELNLHNGDMGGMLRVKGWYDQALEDEDVHFGNQANGYQKSHCPITALTTCKGTKAFTCSTPMSTTPTTWTITRCRCAWVVRC